jgi:3-oxoacyl-[acyl-carrier-protein] synthase II
VPNTPRPAQIDVVMSNSFGFGGHNVSLLFRRFEG